MDSSCLNFVKSCKTFEQFNNLLNDNFNIKLVGTSYSECSLFISQLKEQKWLYVAQDLSTLENADAQLCSTGVKTGKIYSISEMPFDSKNTKTNGELQFTYELLNFIFGNTEVLTITPSVLTHALPKYKVLQNSLINLKKNQICDLNALTNKLIEIGYEKVERPFAEGEFSKRGDIIDIFMYKQNSIIRLDFFDDEIEEIKLLNVEDLSCIGSLSKVCIFPFNINSIKTDGEQESLISILPNQKLMLIEPLKIFDEITFFTNGILKNFNDLIKNEQKYIEFSSFFIEKQKIISNLQKKQVVALCNLSDTNLDYNNFETIYINSVAPRNYLINSKSLIDDLKIYIKTNYKIIIFAGSKFEKESIQSICAQSGVFFVDNSLILSRNYGAFIFDDYLAKSCSIAKDKFVIIGTDDIVKKNAISTKKKKESVFYLPKIGDFVVHEKHGIGKCIKVEALKLTNVVKDYFVIEYANNDILYLPTEQADLISAYLGGEEHPKLNKIGGAEFAKAKERVLASVKDMAHDLIKLYASREKKIGHRYGEDTYLQEAFENSFEFEETEDQLNAVEDIKKDMESSKIMDRLVCGDVGFGKTEVALRAIYKAIQEGFQVAFLCPTTILSEQHYQTCIKRFKNFMVNVEVVNRFKTEKQLQDILNRLHEGKIDVLIGTHAMLSSRMKFKNLGLLVLDEEQRFGVADKEKIKALKKDIDVLCLSATPIPRTLHMALSGIRDISVISTPPSARLPIQTVVTQYSDAIFISAVTKELDRNGQILIVYNRVDSISDFTAFVKKCFPQSRVGIAHGQMPSATLENAINKLYKGEYDIMVATTLIENGIDLPNANTLFVVGADSLGLASLYQLRGRIGRGDRLGYAYFTYDANKQLTDQAYKRLEALTHHTELGSGFRIAMRDLEIRGAGNVLGREQHGQMQKVGYDLYLKLLEIGLKQLSGTNEEEKLDVRLLIDIVAGIPTDYIVDENARIKLYREISDFDNLESIEKFSNILYPKYGDVPIEVKNLCKVALVKNLCQKLKIKSLKITNINAIIEFYNKNGLQNQNILQVIEEYKNQCVLKFESSPIITFTLNGGSVAKNLDNLINILLKFLCQNN